jgi:hypothetical protein
MFGSIRLRDLLRSLHIYEKYRYTITCKKDLKRVKKRIEEIVQGYGISNTHNEYDRALGNAIHHGEYPIKCRVYLGDNKQMVCVVKDSGKGFDYQEVVRKCQNKEVYFHYHGLGFRSYASNDHLCVDWSDQGKTIMMWYRV